MDLVGIIGVLIILRLTGLFLLTLFGSFIKCGDTQIYFNGFRIRIGKKVRSILSDAEFQAVLQHENGHKVHFHVWKNFIRRFLFLSYSASLHEFQERQADSNVSDKKAFARAILKLGITSELDRSRFLNAASKGVW